MVHFITINWFYWSGVWIWKIFRVRFNWKLLRVNLNTTIINVIIINYLHYSWNHRTGFGMRGPGFEVSGCMLAAPLSWWIIWLFTMKGVEIIHISSKNWREEFRSKDDSGISFVSNPSTSFSNSLLYNAKIWNNWLGR